ncbi:hypothetical protein QZM97_02695 [Burkholderia orbicola]|uniref:hypothetical protein n=1 Tax=Burkholderia orbicola TaxID=2978683 RepID=UPI002653C753|nr:hypothetical protein [Burkholderia orbicola]MDN7988978.1 hypothetical protein [Burkholderia orbicola]
MKEPILSREEVGALWTELSGRPFVDGSLADAFAERLESAILEKLCGEPVGFITNVGGYWHMEPTVDWEKIGLSTRLYTIKDRQS